MEQDDNQSQRQISFKEQRVRKVTHLYYSRPEIQKVLFEFSKNREISPRYFEGFGKRPDSFQYPADVFELVKKSATSFHCSEELWQDPLQISTDMTTEQYNKLRIGWDLLIDIDCKWFDYSKLAAKAVLEVFNKNKVINIGIKFSGSKGWHILVPWKAFPKEVGGELTKNLFPELPKKIISYIRFEAEKELKKILPEDFYQQFKDVDIKKGIKCNKCKEIVNEYELANFFCGKCGVGEQRKLPKKIKNSFKCPICSREFNLQNSEDFYECSRCGIDSKRNPNNFSRYNETDLFDLMGLDLALISPRHLFRMPYSLHEKTALASVVLNHDEISNFQLKDADPMNVEVKDFMPESEEGEASELLMQALDWYKEHKPSEENIKSKGKYADFKPIQLTNITEENFPPCVQTILNGIADGKKRALFALINLFRSIGLDKEILEKKIYNWNKKNQVPLKEGYIKSQLSWSYRKKPIMPPNCKEFYQGIAACLPDDLCRIIKNPVNYTIKKNLIANKNNFKTNKDAKKKDEWKDNFKNNP